MWAAQLICQRAAYDGKSTVAPQAGRFTVVIPGQVGSTTSPAGSGYGTVVISKAGKVKLAGALADGTKLSQGSALSSAGSWPLYVPLYSGQGSVMSWSCCSAQGKGSVAGAMTWLKQPNSKSNFYPGGFTNHTEIVGSRYQAASGNSPLTFTSGDLVLAGGNLGQLVVNHVSLDSKGGVKNESDTKLTLTINASQGTFRGKVTPPGATKPVSFGGVILQSSDSGSGYFLGTSQSSFVQLASRDPAAVTFQTLGSSFTAELDFTGINPETVLWQWSDGTFSSNYPVATKVLAGGAANQSLSVSPAGLLQGINIGFDGSDGATNAPIATRDQQNVGAVSFARPLLGLRYWASSYNPITNTLDFSGFLSLEDIECFHCTNLEHVAVANLPSVKRLCFEACDLQELDISGNPSLEDLRAAINGPNAFTEIKTGGGTGPKIWHFCVRDNPQFTQDLQTIMTNFYSLREPWFWNANQSGALKFVSTNLTDVEVQGNQYSSVDLSGQANLQFLWCGGNQITNLVITACTNLLELKAENNQLSAATLDNLLAFLDTSCPNLQVVDLHGNAQPPSAAGCAHAASIMNRPGGVTVYTDCP